MNQQQREYLVKTIQANVKQRVRALEDQIPPEPNLENHLTTQVLSGKLQVRPSKEIKAYIEKRVKNLNGVSHLLDGATYRSSTSTELKIQAKHLFVLPKVYQELKDEYDRVRKIIRDDIAILEAEEKALIMRVRLASNKVLDTLVADIDDMGDVRLIDTKLKAITA